MGVTACLVQSTSQVPDIFMTVTPKSSSRNWRVGVGSRADPAAYPWLQGVCTQCPDPNIYPCGSQIPHPGHSVVGMKLRVGQGEPWPVGLCCPHHHTTGHRVTEPSVVPLPCTGGTPVLGWGARAAAAPQGSAPPQLRSHQDQGLQCDQPPGTAWEREGPHEGSGLDRGVPHPVP